MQKKTPQLLIFQLRALSIFFCRIGLRLVSDWSEQIREESDNRKVRPYDYIGNWGMPWCPCPFKNEAYRPVSVDDFKDFLSFS